MWPFSSSDEEDEEECDHEWEEMDEYGGADVYIDSETGEPRMYRYRLQGESCKHCWKTDVTKQTNEHVYLNIDRVEEDEVHHFE